MSHQDTSNHYSEEPHDVSKPHAHHTVPYVLIFFALAGLTVLTVVVALKRFDNELINVLLALLVASIKASLVALFFMHLKFEGKLVRTIFLVPLALCILLIVALIPDVIMTKPDSHSASLHRFTPQPMMDGGQNDQ